MEYFYIAEKSASCVPAQGNYCPYAIKIGSYHIFFDMLFDFLWLSIVDFHSKCFAMNLHLCYCFVVTELPDFAMIVNI